MELNSYDRDYHQWLTEAATTLNAGPWNDLDVANLVDELDALGKSQKRAIESYLKILLLHLLKWTFRPGMRSGSRRSSIRNAHLGICDRIEESPSLQDYPATCLKKCYRVARANAADETGLSIDQFSANCPFALADILREDFLPQD